MEQTAVAKWPKDTPKIPVQDLLVNIANFNYFKDKIRLSIV